MSCTYTLCLPDLECLVLSNLVIDCVSGYVSALLNLAGGLAWHPAGVVHATCPAPSQGGGQRTSGCRDCVWVNAGMFLGIRSDILHA